MSSSKLDTDLQWVVHKCWFVVLVLLCCAGGCGKAEADRNPAQQSSQPVAQEPPAEVLQMKKWVQVELVAKQSIVTEPPSARTDDEVILTIRIANRAPQDIVSLNAHLTVADSANKSLGEIDMHINSRIASGKAVGWLAPIELEGETGQKLLSADEKTLDLIFEPESIYFADGSSIRAPIKQ